MLGEHRERPQRHRAVAAAEQQVADDLAVHLRHQRQRPCLIAAQRVDDVGLLRAPEGRLLDVPDGLAVLRPLLADRDHPRDSAGASPAGTSW
jgi:hypothetical protein